jgi:hypothetical protein
MADTSRQVAAVKIARGTSFGMAARRANFLRVSLSEALQLFGILR